MLKDEFSKWLSSLKRDINTVLETDVADTLRNHILESVEQRVYAVYEPSDYIRRRSDRGLQDPANYPAFASWNELVIRNETRDNYYSRSEDRYIVDVVESGSDYDWCSPGPRPFMEEALQDGLTDGSLEESLYNGLKKLGY